MVITRVRQPMEACGQTTIEASTSCSVAAVNDHPIGASGDRRNGTIAVITNSGSWGHGPSGLRSADRSRNGPGGRFDNVGFRLARTSNLGP